MGFYFKLQQDSSMLVLSKKATVSMKTHAAMRLEKLQTTRDPERRCLWFWRVMINRVFLVVRCMDREKDNLICHTYGIPLAYAHNRLFFCL